MKKLFKSLLYVALLCITLSFPHVAGASEIPINNQEPISEKIDFNSLSKEEAAHFEKEGFTEENEFFKTTVIQQPTSLEGSFSTFGLNIVTLTGSTKKYSDTLGYTSYVIVATKAGFQELNTKLTYGTKSKTSSVIPYGRPLVYSGGIFFENEGKKQYFSCKLSTQYYTSMGKATVSASAGGTTLGKEK